jgi:hypothetical protein
MKVFSYMEESFNIKLVKGDFNNLLSDIPNNDVNKELIYDYLIGFVNLIY